ncbi:MAG: flagellar biosynthesis protein FlhB [Bdellovibrionota bacterium]
MSSEENDSEKTEDPTAQRREDFRKQGQVAQSKELATVLMLFGASLLIWMLGRYFFAQMAELFVKSYGDFIITAARDGDYKTAILFAGKKALNVILPVFGLVFLIGISASLFQIGFLSTSETISPNFDKINPINGLKKLLSMTSVVEGLKAIIKVSIIGFVVYTIIKTEILKSPFMINYTIEQLSGYFGDISFRLIFGVAIAMTFLALFDYGFQRWEMEKKMRMTKQEIKEEVKTREGDPHIKARIRRIQRELANKRMMTEVPKADVIITNPTHLSIALKYSANLPAPQVIAKGAGAVALRIRELAKEHEIPIVENKPLARTIFKTLKVGQIIPRELFNAVAEVLAYVYKLRRKRRPSSARQPEMGL